MVPGLKIFGEQALTAYLDEGFAELRRAVRTEDKNRLLNVSEPDYVAYLVSGFRLEPIEFHQDKAYVTQREEMIRAERFPADFRVSAGSSYSKQVVTYYLPFSGSPLLLRMAPSPRNLWTMPVAASEQEIWFDVVNFRDDPEEIKRNIDDNVQNILAQCLFARNQINQFNAALPERAATEIATRKQELLKQASLLAQLGVPFRAKHDVSQTFAIPTVKHKPIIAKPVAPTTAFAPEPTLDEETYRRILKVCHDTGVEMERHPSIYIGKGEETLRDHFIMVLAPHFESVTGETFNRQGKTDILIRHEGKNVFVAECKFWRGAKQHQEAIDQVLSYLTWRDSKAAILYFVDNKNFDPVLTQIPDETVRHPAFVESKGSPEEASFNFRFHLPKDSSRNVILTVLCFHFPAND